MHSLIGCFPVDLDPSPPPLPPIIPSDKLELINKPLLNEQQQIINLPYEEVDGVKYWRIEIKLSQIYKRVFFLKSVEERDIWYGRLVKAAKIRSVNEDYELLND
jgi:hypothetical protein